MEKKKLKLLSLFSGIGAPEKALTNLGIDWELINFCEIDKYASKSYCAIHGVDESLNLGDITKVDESKLDKDIDILTFGFPCVPKGSLVKTEEGYKAIEEIKEGDKVLTHKNRYRAVLKTMMRTSDHINTIRGVGCYGLRATDEHPLYINRNGVYRWIQVKDIKEGDRITYNINQHSKQTAFSDEELWILGRYVADGYLEKHSLQRAVFCIGKNKIQEFESFLNKTKYEYVVYHKERNCCEYKINDCSLTSFIKANIGTGSKDKFISQAIINLDKSKLIHFLEGYFSGDGFCRKDRETWMFTTVSEKVFLALQDIIIKLFNLVPSVYLRADTRKASFSNNYCCSFSSYPKDQIYSNGQISVLVKNVKRKHKATDVYNIEVEEDNSYVVNNVIVHNCQDISVAGKQKGLIDADGNKTRSGLFFDALRIIKATRPKIAIAENVKALTQKKFSEQFRTVLDSLSELGYDNYWDILNASGFGIPQERERVFIVSIRQDISQGNMFWFPQPRPLKLRLKDMLEDKVDEKYYLNEIHTKTLLANSKINKQIEGRITARLNKHNKEIGGGKSYVLMSQSCVDHLNQETSGTLTARYYKGVYASGDNVVLEPNGNRGGVQAKLIKVGNTTPSGKSQCCSVYDPNGIYPTVCAGTHGNANPSILEIKEIIDDE